MNTSKLLNTSAILLTTLSYAFGMDTNPSQNTNQTLEKKTPKELESKKSLKTTFLSSDNFSFKAGAEVFSKTSFNNSAIDEAKQVYPTPSYASILANLGIYYEKDGFKLGLGGVAGGLLYDSTRATLGFINAEGYNYIGFYAGYSGLGVPNITNTRDFIIYDAYLEYENKYIDATLGRFFKENTWFGGYAQGINLAFNLGKGQKITLFGTDSMSIWGSGWLYDFSRLYIPTGVLNLEYELKRDFYNFKLYAYYGIEDYVAPGASLDLLFGDSKVAYLTKIVAALPIYDSSINKWGVMQFFGSTSGVTGSVFLRQDVIFNEKYTLGLGLYKNFGNANARFGTYGNPMNIDIWDNSVLVYGRSLNAAVNPDVFNLLLYTNFEIGKYLDIKLDGRYSTSPMADEYSLILGLDIFLTSHITYSLKANYYTNITHAGFDVLTGLARKDAPGVISDRSYVMNTIKFEY
ncbi:hypothetical protein BKH43_02400 [Helicobacter sp. 13S00401-1]|uniref:outer membrane family protein n=1 Tax=Helicobacter sp. 13S00401-1 TaxID=1905758 RepID=UPI000BA5B14D|nr:outer membrane family protein [Helicobacter sp. 13S00401-1]PAF51080.1 hypothetical protein BKH43_02400 [Helicobacter sp. 13S00401-1]